MTKDQIIAEIATSLTDKPQPTAAEILVGLRRAFEAGQEYSEDERYARIIKEVMAL